MKMGKTGKWMVAAGLVAAAAIGLAGCGSSSDSSAASEQGKVIRVGAETTFPPFEFVENEKYVGFGLDLADAVVKQMGAKMEFKSMGFDALIPAIQSNQIDLIASGMDATPERAKQVLFSDPYFTENGYVILVKKDNSNVNDWGDLKGKVVGAQVGTESVKLAQENGASQVKQLDSNAQAFMELKAGTVDAVILDRPVSMYYLNKGADKDVKIVGTPKDGAPMVFAMSKDNEQLQKDVNAALKELKDNGTYDKIHAKWFGASSK